MRTKTLLLAAATLVAGFLSAKADTVYSQNVVGYVNCTVTNGRFALIANQLDTGSNTLQNVLGAGAVSGDTTVAYWTGSGFKTYIYYNSDDSPDAAAGWFSLTDVRATNNLSPGQGVFAHNSSGANIQLTTVGQVLQGTNNWVVTPGLNFYSVLDPIGGKNLQELNFPAESGNDSYIRWTGSAYTTLIYYNSDDAPDAVGGWYTLTDVPKNTDPTAWPKAGESFFINHGGATITWTNVFNVQ